MSSATKEENNSKSAQELAGDFQEDPFKNYRYEDPFLIEDPFKDENGNEKGVKVFYYLKIFVNLNFSLKQKSLKHFLLRKNQKMPSLNQLQLLSHSEQVKVTKAITTTTEVTLILLAYQ